MTSIRNIVTSIFLIPFLLSFVMPSGMDLHISYCENGNWGVSVAACPSASIPLHPSSCAEVPSSCNCNGSCKDFILICGGGLGCKTDHISLELYNPQNTSLSLYPNILSDFFTSSPEPVTFSCSAASSLDFRKTFPLVTPLLI